MYKNLLIVALGAAITLLVLGFTTGIIPTWIKNNLNKQEEQEIALTSPSPEVIKPTPSPKPVEDISYVPTTKGGLVLGETKNVASPKTQSNSYATVIYEYKEKSQAIWQVRANYDTRYESYIDFDEVSPSFDRKVTICLINNTSQIKCESGSTDVGVHKLGYQVGGKDMVYEIVADKNGPTMTFEGPWKNSSGQTCVRVINMHDNISPINMIAQSERMDDQEWRSVHSEYCISDDAGKEHKYQVRLKDERGNETTSTLTFKTL